MVNMGHHGVIGVHNNTQVLNSFRKRYTGLPYFNMVPMYKWATCWADNYIFVLRVIEFEHVIIGIDHNTVCAVVVGTAIRHSTSSAGRRAAAPAGTTSAVPDSSTNHDSADHISGQFLFYHDHNFTKSKGNKTFSTSCTAVCPRRRLLNDAWRRDS